MVGSRLPTAPGFNAGYSRIPTAVGNSGMPGVIGGPPVMMGPGPILGTSMAPGPAFAASPMTPFAPGHTGPISLPTATGMSLQGGTALASARPFVVEQEALGGGMGKQWQYVGEGRGGFEKKQEYAYVGMGQGSFNREVVTKYYGWRLRNRCFACMLVAPLLALTYAVVVWIYPDSLGSSSGSPVQSKECAWAQHPGVFSGGYAGVDTTSSLKDAMHQCLLLGSDACKAVTCDSAGKCSMRGSASLSPSPSGEITYVPPIDCFEAANTTSAPEQPATSSGTTVPLGPPAATAATAPTTTTSGATAAPATTPRYACGDDVRSGKSTDTVERAWCCKELKVGCPTTTTQATSTATVTPFDCQADGRMWQTGWSEGKKDWCCRHTGKGCPVTTTPVKFECKAHHNWERAWSDSKKAWCCEHKKFGCPKEDK
jgi:hypothetical protein